MEVSLALNLDFRVRILVLGAVLDVPPGHEVVLHPDDLVQSLDEGDFALDVQARVGEDGFVDDVLDVAETGAEVDVFDVEGVFSAKANVHHAIWYQPLLSSVSGGVELTRLCRDTPKTPSYSGPSIVCSSMRGGTSCDA